jgi:hypothetical protein
MALARAKLRTERELERRKYSLAELGDMAKMPRLFDVEGAPEEARDTLPVGVGHGSHKRKGR